MRSRPRKKEIKILPSTEAAPSQYSLGVVYRIEPLLTMRSRKLSESDESSDPALTDMARHARGVCWYYKYEFAWLRPTD